MKSFILWLLTPIQKFLQRAGRQETRMTYQQVSDVLLLIKQGDIVLSFEYGRPTSILIKGFFDHAAIVTSKLTIMEAVGDRWVDNKNIGGVREVDLEEWLYKKDYVAVIRPSYKDGDLTNKLAAAAALYYKGKGYDYKFERGDESVYCSELEYLCYSMYDPRFLEDVDGEILPQLYFDLTNDVPRSDGMTFDLVYDSRKTKGL